MTDQPRVNPDADISEPAGKFSVEVSGSSLVANDSPPIEVAGVAIPVDQLQTVEVEWPFGEIANVTFVGIPAELANQIVEAIMPNGSRAPKMDAGESFHQQIDRISELIESLRDAYRSS